MIKKVSLDDKELFNALGLQVNNNFLKLFVLDNLLNSAIDYIYGYYDNDILLGFIHLQVIDSVDVVNIVVDKCKRHKGIGKSLLKYALTKFGDKSFMLEVDEDNKVAIELYLKNDFKVISKRLHYYSNGNNALVMKRDELI